MTLPFEVSFEHIQANPDAYIEAIFASLVSDFLVLPRGRGGIAYPVFEQGYEALKRTARDKVTRVQHLDRLSTQGQPPNQPKFEVVACIGGRGFGVRREDMRKLLYATKGKVFTLNLLDKLVEYTRLQEFTTTQP